MAAEALDLETERDIDHLLAPVRHWSKRFIALVLVLSGIVAWGIFAYAIQLLNGLAVTNMRDTVSWGTYIADFTTSVGPWVKLLLVPTPGSGLVVSAWLTPKAT